MTKLCDLGQDDCVTSVGWTQRGTHLAVGTNQGHVQLWDAAKCHKVRTITGHSARIGTLAWNTQVGACVRACVRPSPDWQTGPSHGSIDP